VRKLKRLYRGQALVIVLLIVGVGLTVGLAIISRSVTEVNVTTVQEESARALEAAEAGVEQAFGGLIAGSGGTGTLPSSNATFNVANSNIGAGTVYEVPFVVDQGDAATVDMTGYSGNNVRICWGKNSEQTGVEVILYFDPGSGLISSGRGGYDPQGRWNFMVSDTGNCGTMGYTYSKLVDLSELGMTSGTPLFLRIRPVFNSTPVRLAVVAVGSSFPVQGTEIQSTGQAGNASQRIKATAANPDLPAIFDNAVFSGSSLIK